MFLTLRLQYQKQRLLHYLLQYCFYLIRYVLTEHNGIQDDVISEAIQIKNGEIADFIKIDKNNESNEYHQKIKSLVDENDDFDLEKMFEDDERPSNEHERDIFEIIDDDSESINPMENDIDHKEYRTTKSWEEDDNDDDLFNESDFDDIDFK